MKPIIVKLFHAVLLLFVVAFIGCGRSEPNFPIDIEYFTIGKGELYGNGKENLQTQSVLITNAVEWNNLVEKMDSYNNVSNSFVEKNIDFEKFVVLAVIDSIRPTLYNIEIDGIVEDASVVSAFVKRQSKDATVVCQPFCIVKIKKSTKL